MLKMAAFLIRNVRNGKGGYERNMKEINWKSCCKRIADIGCICFIILTVFAYISDFNINIFLYDDNYSQWLPIINKTYGELIETGKLNMWDMRLMNGINILDTGIYSILNPFMLVSYAIYEILGISNTISIYIYIIVCLSMLVYNSIMKKYKMSFATRMIFVFCLLGCSCYYKLGNWYYVFNNLFIGMMLSYYFLKISKSMRYYFAGIVLGFSIYMGNVQYTMMWYMFFAIIMIIMTVMYHKKCLLVMGTNIMIGVILNFPQLILNARASVNSAAFHTKNVSFFEYPLHLFNILVRGVIPECIISYFSKVEMNEYYFSKGFYFNGILMISLFAAIVLIIKKKERKYFEKIIVAYMAAAIFFVVYTLGKGYIVADILNVIPLVNRFRYLHKAYFLIPPILAVIMIYVYCELHKNRNIKIFLGGGGIACID